MAWRDVQLSDTCAVAVDATGDVVQWGAGFGAGPTKTLTGMNIRRVQLSGGKVYALSHTGHVYVFAQAREHQSLAQRSWFSPSMDYVKLSADEKLVDIAAGDHHVLALSRQGHVYSVPADDQANEYGQLGYSAVLLGHATSPSRTCEAVLEPAVVRRKRMQAQPATPPSDAPPLRPPTDIRYATAWRLVPSLQESTFAEIAAGTAHSVVRTADGRVLTWGRNSNGQLGLGAHVTYETIAVPREVEFPLSVVGRHATCTKIAAGGANTFFVMHSRGAPVASDQSTDAKERVDVLAVGAGQYGTLGHGQRNQSCGVPVRVKAVSGLQEYSESLRALRPIDVHAISVGDRGQCALVMEAPSLGNQTRRDVYVWGHNGASQLANGKKSHAAIPALLSMAQADAPDNLDAEPVVPRILLVEQTRARAQSFDGRERTFARVEQRIVAGGSCMALYAGVV